MLFIRLIGLAAMCLVVSTFAGQHRSQNRPVIVIPSKFQKLFVGKIGDKYPIHLELERRDKSLFGSYYYDNIGMSIDVDGTIDDRGGFQLTELDGNGYSNAAFNGTIGYVDSRLIMLSGTWKKDGEAASLPFRILETRFDLGTGAKFVSKNITRNVKQPRYTVDVRYPQITAPINSGQEGFNKYIESIMAKKVPEFKFLVVDKVDPADLPPGADPSELNIDYKVPFASAKLISVVFDVSEYAAGTRHPELYSITVNYDLENKKDLRLSDLFKPKAKYLTAISEYCEKRLTSKLGHDNEELIKSGTGPRAENYKRWSITDKGLLITFDPYQVPSALPGGGHEVLIPYRNLSTLLAEPGPTTGVVMQ